MTKKEILNKHHLQILILLAVIFSTSICFAESAILSKSNLKNHRKVCPLVDGGRQLIHSTAPNLALQGEVQKRRSVSTLSKPRALARGASNGLIQTPWGEVQTPMAILPYFYCPRCGRDVNIGDCEHRKDYTAPKWIRQYALWLKGKFEVEGEMLAKFIWLNDNAVVFSDGFESNDFSAWTGTGTSGTSTITTTSAQAREGTYSAVINIPDSGMNGANAYKNLPSTYSTLYYRIYYRHDTAYSGTTENTLMPFRAVNNGATIASLSYQANSGTPRWSIWDQANITSYTYNEAINTNQWYCLELMIVVSSTAGQLAFWRDGTQLINQTNINTGTTNVGTIRASAFGPSTSPGNHYFDSVIVDDANYIGQIKDPALIKDALINNAMIK